MSSLYQEAWESFRRGIETDAEAASLVGIRYSPSDVLGAMNIHLQEARQRVKETLKELAAKHLCSCPKCGKDTMVKNKCLVCK